MSRRTSAYPFTGIFRWTKRASSRPSPCGTRMARMFRPPSATTPSGTGWISFPSSRSKPERSTASRSSTACAAFAGKRSSRPNLELLDPPGRFAAARERTLRHRNRSAASQRERGGRHRACRAVGGGDGSGFLHHRIRLPRSPVNGKQRC